MEIDVLPNLLVSIRNVDELDAAVAGGCDVIDIKEPTRGSLGMADVETIAGIVNHATQSQVTLPLSCALGETLDWTNSVTRIPAEMSFVKLGLAGLGSRADWQHLWKNVRTRFDAAADRRLNWIAVVYADWQLADAPEPAEILNAVSSEDIDDRCVGLLVDTFSKTEKRLVDWFDIVDLAALFGRAREFGLKTAIAGRLSIDVLGSLVELEPDIVAIRSAACRDLRRDAKVSADAIRGFRRAMEEHFRTVTTCIEPAAVGHSRKGANRDP